MATKNFKTNADAFLFKLVGNKPKQMSKSAQNAVVGKNTTTQGEIVYFLPKDKNGKLTGAPVKFLKLTKGGVPTGDYIQGDKVVALFEDEFKTGFTALDDIRNQMNEYGANGNTTKLDVSNMDALDEDFSYLTNESLINKYGTITNRSLITESSNFTNESLLDGLTENTSLLNANGKDDKEKKSNPFADWWKKTFGNKKPEATSKIADPNVAIVDEKTMAEAYKESGSKKSYKEWVNSEGGKSIMNSITQIASLISNNPYMATNIGSGGSWGGDNIGDNTPKEETTILGMSPVTFGFVAVGLIVIGAIAVSKMSGSGAKVKVA